jgi:hypothetical protein
VFFGTGWIGTAVSMRYLAIAAAVDLLTATSSHVAVAAGFVRRCAITAGIRFVLTGVCVAVAAEVWHSLAAVAAAVLVATCASVGIQQVLVARVVSLPLGLLREDLVAVGTSAVVMFVVTVGVDAILLAGAPAWVRLAVGVPLGVAVYGGMAVVFFRRITRTVWVDLRLRSLRPVRPT